MANCTSCGTNRPMIIEAVGWREVEGELLCPECAKNKVSELSVTQARAALAAGNRLFQLALPLSQTTGNTTATMGEHTTTTTTRHAPIFDGIEAEGWRLEHAAYVGGVKGDVGDNLFSSGEQDEIIGVYIFRAN